MGRDSRNGKRSKRDKDDHKKKKQDDKNKESSEEESSSDGEPEVELMVNSRARRANAGNKMGSLLESTTQEDEFYQSAYGGFNEEGVDVEYESPVESDGDEVDSDFDKPEEEDEPISDQEGEKTGRPRRKAAYKEPRRGELEKNKKWVMARMGGAGVAPNTVDAKTQAERLKEAEKTEKINVESLRKYEQFELERKKKRDKSNSQRKVPPPFVSYRSSVAFGDQFVVPDIKTFERPKKHPTVLCAVTGRPAKYNDPVTGLPYNSSFAFKVIRDKYHKFLKNVKGNEEVEKYMDKFITN